MSAEDRSRLRRRALEIVSIMPEDEQKCRYLLQCVQELLAGYCTDHEPTRPRLVDVKAMRAKKEGGTS